MKKNILLLSCILWVTVFGCSKNFDTINQNPNKPSKVEPDFLLTTSILKTMNLYGGEMNRVVFFNYTHHFSGFQGEFQRYNFNVGLNSTYWRNTYVDCIQPVHQIIVNYQNNPAYRNRVLIAKIWKNYLFSNTVAIWGAVPTKGALSGTSSVPFTKEQEIYTNLLTELKQQADSLVLDGDRYTSIADKIYAGDVLKWKKFAQTLRLRLAIRISNDAPNGDPVLAKSVIEEIARDEQSTISAQSETAAAIWGTTSDTWSPLYDRAVFNYTANIATIPVANESLIYHMAPYNDSRLGIYAQPAKQGPNQGSFFGQNISYGGGGEFASGNVNPHTGLKQVDYSALGERFLKPNAEYVFLSHAEACFLKAEAAQKGWWNNATAEQYYYQGIDASYAHYGLSAQQATDYKNVPGIKWGTATNTVGREDQFKDWLQICSSVLGVQDNYKRIIMQHWLSIPGQGIDAWTLIRRTRVLEFQPQFATYDGQYAYLPNRLLYPNDELNTNRAEVEKAISWLNGPDELKTKLWFAMPVQKNPFLPY